MDTASHSHFVLFRSAAILGTLAHQFFFKRVEVDTHPLLIALTFLGAPYAVKHVLSSYFQQYAQVTIRTSFFVVGCFLLSLWASMLLYRAFFHPLNKFPGPSPAKLSKLWALTQTAKTGLRWYQVDTSLHQRYGDYVRTGLSPQFSQKTTWVLLIWIVGPRELSITDPEAVSLIYGFTSKTFKGPFYDSMEESVSTTRDKVFHKQRRQVWDSSLKSCEDFEPLIRGTAMLRSIPYCSITARNSSHLPTASSKEFGLI